MSQNPFFELIKQVMCFCSTLQRGRMLACLLPLLLSTSAFGASKSVLLLEAEQFAEPGGWAADSQFMDQMGSPYLLAHGLGKPVADATTEAVFDVAGAYRVWVRTRDWVAPWNAPGAPGRFQVLLNGKALSTTFGTEGAEWHWQDGGIVNVEKRVKVVLHDLTGFEGRCDAVLFCRDTKFQPPNKSKALAEFRRRVLGLAVEPAKGGDYDLVVVGGGIAGTCAAVSAARLGLSVALVQDRPMLGGNNSSEIRVWLAGKVNLPPYERIGDIVTELEPARRALNAPGTTVDVVEDERRLALVRSEKNIRLFLNYRANEVEKAGSSIKAVVAQNTTSGERVRLTGRLFADCTGDGSVGFVAGADYEMTEKQHMGLSNLWKVKDSGRVQAFPARPGEDAKAVNATIIETPSPSAFPRCPWAVDLSDKVFPGRQPKTGAKIKEPLKQLGRWFWESGFDRDPVTDAEWIRDLNFRAMYGAWDALKNVDKLYPNHKLDYAPVIAGKRESRRLLGDVVLERADIQSGRVFEDACFPCTWMLDLHTPHPTYQAGHEGNEFIAKRTSGPDYEYKGPYWAPYRCLYSRNIDNLFMAGRDISVTHEALGAVRVMRTTGAMGEIVGMAASICKERRCGPRDVYKDHLKVLKALMVKGAGKNAHAQQPGH